MYQHSLTLILADLSEVTVRLVVVLVVGIDVDPDEPTSGSAELEQTRQVGMHDGSVRANVYAVFCRVHVMDRYCA